MGPIMESAWEETDGAPNDTTCDPTPDTSGQRNKGPNQDSLNRETQSLRKMGIEENMHAIHAATKLFPSLHSAIGNLMAPLEHFRASRINQHEYNNIVSQLNEMTEYLKRNGEGCKSKQLKENISKISKTINREIDEVRKLQQDSKTTQVLRAGEREIDLKHRFRRIEELFRRIQMETSMIEWSNIREALTQDNQLKELKPAMLALYNSHISHNVGRGPCTQDTRSETLAEIEKWYEDPAGPAIFWLNGMAGTGKTTIAYTIANKLEAQGRLEASFFCTIASEECKAANGIIPTIAYQLSYQSTPFKAKLGEAIEQHPNAPTSLISNQLDWLLVDTLSAAAQNMPKSLVVVIDALDECSDRSMVGLLLKSLFAGAIAGKLPIKFLITSRPEPRIYEALASQSDDLRSVLNLHEVNQDSVQQDIRKYLQQELSSLLDHETGDKLDCLVESSGQLFIYAATAVRYIDVENPEVDSRDRLDAMVAIESNSTQRHADIDALYHRILSRALEKKEPFEREKILSVVWTVVCRDSPTSFAGIAILAGLRDEKATSSVLASLRSVLHVSKNQDVSTFHASFPQFILDRSRSDNFSCGKGKVREAWSLRCLKTLRIELSSHPNLTDVSPRLEFADRHWVILFESQQKFKLTELCSELEWLFENHFDGWLRRIMRKSFLQEKTEAPQKARRLRKFLEPTSDLLPKLVSLVSVAPRYPQHLRQALINTYIYLRNPGCRDDIRNQAIENKQNGRSKPMSSTNGTRTHWIWEQIDYDVLEVELHYGIRQVMKRNVRSSQASHTLIDP
ncbi:WD domain, G-beta repeat [Rhizoctonia solani]|uniref:WD domain, G-beta repeat n=1 Tax=Rhizoctonia solani TaxID=456999 RepID=A0A8H7I736_9AGAM|nr:WD domain, G-beta repeat [Rhizoctonia solani]